MAGEVTFTAIEADYVSANLSWTRNAGQTRMLRWLAVAGVVLAASSIGLGIATGRTIRDTIADSIWVLIFLAIVIGIRLATPLLVRQQVRKMVAQNLALQDPVRCWWDTQAINFAGSNGTGHLGWDRLHRWLDDDATFVFLQSDRLMFILPKRVLTPAQGEDLQATIRAAAVRRW